MKLCAPPRDSSKHLVPLRLQTGTAAFWMAKEKNRQRNGKSSRRDRQHLEDFRQRLVAKAFGKPRDDRADNKRDCGSLQGEEAKQAGSPAVAQCSGYFAFRIARRRLHNAFLRDDGRKTDASGCDGWRRLHRLIRTRVNAGEGHPSKLLCRQKPDRLSRAQQTNRILSLP